MPTPKTSTLEVKNVFILYSILLVVWGFYRVLFKLPQEVEELILKPIIWLGPLFYFLAKEKKGLSSVGWTFKGLFKGIYWGLGLGILFGAIAIFSNSLKYGGGLSLSPDILNGENLLLGLSLSFVTAIAEETVFRGYIFNRLTDYLGNSLVANIMTTIGWGIIHLPVLIFSYHFGLSVVILQLFLSCIFSFGASLIFARTQNIISPILLNVLWTWPIVLFR